MKYFIVHRGLPTFVYSDRIGLMKQDKAQSNIPVPLPKDLEEKYRNVEQEFYKLIPNNPDPAFKMWRELYSEVLKRQPDDKRYHKGGEVHNMGITKYFSMSPIEALNYFMLGYIEDVLSTKTESGARPEDAPGAQNLKNLFGLKDQHFQLLRKLVNESIEEKGLVQDPQYVLDNLPAYTEKQEIERVAKDFSPLLKKHQYPISQIHGELEKRVFIGGSYGRLYILNWITKAVLKSNYIPIIPREFRPHPDLPTRNHSLLLLHNCKYAIFDISTMGGHLMEIERTFDYKTYTLFLCEKVYAASVSAMLSSLDKPTHFFKDYNDIKGIVEQFLKSNS